MAVKKSQAHCWTSVQSRRPQQIQFSIPRRAPPLKHHAPTRHHEEVAVPGGLGGVGGQRTVRAMVVDEIFKVSQ
jgi:hypothetical protein